MNESTQQETAAGTPTGYGFCSWHKRFAADVRLIDHIEQSSGPGGGHYACAPCREAYRLVPLADRP
ncbi:hypothetical protein [Streptomyces sp. JB150]|uniref:hypothetical protein n=1 Tax=Streptomyces sp. JB150 TaxID=2714844 RepID=UPI00140D13B5|nr:hypothetical protein [Streptomyces sp. JB150]QIJ62226.1 hypothetical protein G7Z13_09340 [Streptomyces sp. JB150]